jgi:hypothetical protein
MVFNTLYIAALVSKVVLPIDLYMCLIKKKGLFCVERGLPSANFVKDSLFLRITGRTLVLSRVL